MRLPAAIGAFVVLCVVGAVVFVVLLPEPEPPDCGATELPDAAEWAALDGQDQDSLRNDLAGCDLFVGLSPDEVEAAFGTPFDQVVTDDGNDQWVYELDRNGDYVGGESVPPDHWVLTFGEDHRIVETEVVDV